MTIKALVVFALLVVSMLAPGLGITSPAPAHARPSCTDCN